MKARNLALIAVLAAGSWSGAVRAQPNYPPPPPPDQGYGNQPYDNQGYDNQGYNNQDPNYDDQNPYYDDQGPDSSYDNPDPNYDQGYDPNAGYNANGQVDVSVFYSNLHPYGRWIQRASYGWVWEPTRVRVGWRPYTVGRWVNTEYGWTWVSDEPWGWATYHYGRWLEDPEYGWLWVPGREWGPAWCSFQQGNGYIGWAPLPPSVGFQVGFGIQIGGLRLSASIAPRAYSFVPERAFLESRVDRVIVPQARNLTFIRNTRDITSIRVINNRIVNQSVPVQRIEQVTGQRVQRFRVSEVRNPNQAPRGAQVQGDQIRIFRPAPTLQQARPEVTPQAVINRRAQRQAQPQGQTPVQGQPAQPEGRWRRQSPPQAQPGQPAQPQPVPQRQPRWQQPAQPGAQPDQPQPVPQAQQPRGQRQQRPASQDELDRKHQAEQQRLQAQQNEERSRLQQMHQQEQADRQNQRDQARAQQVQAQHEAEMQAQQQQQQREQQQLRNRQQRERPAPQARPQGQPDRPNQQQERQNRGQGQQDQGQGQQDHPNRRNRKEEERKQQPPPPPPPGR
jgi:hypothetical protein